MYMTGDPVLMLSPASVYMGKTVEKRKSHTADFPLPRISVYTDAMWLINSGTDLSLLFWSYPADPELPLLPSFVPELNFDHIADLHFHGRFRRFAVDQHPSCVTRFIGYRSPFDQPGHF